MKLDNTFNELLPTSISDWIAIQSHKWCLMSQTQQGSASNIVSNNMFETSHWQMRHAQFTRLMWHWHDINMQTMNISNSDPPTTPCCKCHMVLMSADCANSKWLCSAAEQTMPWPIKAEIIRNTHAPTIATHCANAEGGQRGVTHAWSTCTALQVIRVKTCLRIQAEDSRTFHRYMSLKSACLWIQMLW